MDESIVIVNHFRYHLPYYFPKPSQLTPNSYTFLCREPHIKLSANTPHLQFNCIKLTRNTIANQFKPYLSYDRFEFSDLCEKENVPPPPPLPMRRSITRQLLTALQRL